MTITRVNPDWAFGGKLSSDQLDGIENNTTYALDKRTGQTDTLGSVVTLGATGRIIQSASPAPNADATYQIDTQVLSVRIGTPNVLTAQRSYTLSNTNASNGDELTFFFDPGALGSFNALIKDNGGTTLATLGPTGDAHWGTFKFISGAWKVKCLGGQRKLVDDTFTANGTWTCPIDVTDVIVIGCGGGGGGGGGSAGGATDVQSSGGGGGGGAPRCVHHLAVTPGASYAVVVGAGGTAGIANGGDGGDGSDSTFGGVLTFPGGQGGLGGVTQSGTPTTSYRLSPGGHPTRGGIRPDKIAPTSTTILMPSMPSGSGGYGRTKSTTPNTISAGTVGLSGFAGGAAGSAGSDTGANIYGGGPGAGGGGGAFGAGGAGGNGAGAVGGDVGTPGSAGTAGAANTGAGGGGGGGGGSNDGAFAAGAGGAGAAGGSGKVIVLYVK